MSTDKKKIEDQFQELEKIVSKVESGDLGLESSLEKLKQGTKIAGGLKSRLKQVQDELNQLKSSNQSE